MLPDVDYSIFTRNKAKMVVLFDSPELLKLWSEEGCPVIGCEEGCPVIGASETEEQIKERLRIRRDNEKIENHEKQRLGILKRLAMETEEERTRL